jgi:hypothetical protein
MEMTQVKLSLGLINFILDIPMFEEKRGVLAIFQNGSEMKKISFSCHFHSGKWQLPS